MNYLGIDNGLDGGLVLLGPDENIIVSIKMPFLVVSKKPYRRQYDELGIVEKLHLLAEAAPMVAVLEHAQPMGKSGRIANFTSGFCFGIITGVLHALARERVIKYQVISAKEWQGKILHGIPGDTKARSIKFCQRYFPASISHLRASEKTGSLHDGLTDAACMALYAKRFIDSDSPRVQTLKTVS